MNYNDLLDDLYMENKGIDFGLRCYKNYNKAKVEILNDDGRRVIYGHLREFYVKPGDKVTKQTTGRRGI